MDIAEVARQSGLASSTLRYYEEKGLIASIGRQGIRRVFGSDVLERLALIALGRQAGFSLDEIAGMFAPDGSLAIDRQGLLAKADDIDRLIKRLHAMSDGLRHAAVCPASSHMECASFRRLLRAASVEVASSGKRGEKTSSRAVVPVRRTQIAPRVRSKATPDRA
ncbi:MAG: helix-turn-helix domain-containing protein [Pseudacidovorax sp.]|nr:helix-turn-helix domain-containing protein [Pseudacidovorax sp.]